MARGGLPFIVEGDRSAATERMFCYRAATAATERLYAFYPAADAVGERLAPSELFARAAALSAPWEEEPLWEAQTPASIETALAGCGSPGPGEGLQAAALRSAARRVLGEERCRRLEAAAEKQGHRIGDGRWRAVYSACGCASPRHGWSSFTAPLLLLHEQRPWGESAPARRAFTGAGGHPDSSGAGTVGRALRRRGAFHRSRAGTAQRNRPADRRLPRRTARGFVTGAPTAGGRLPPHWRLALRAAAPYRGGAFPKPLRARRL